MTANEMLGRVAAALGRTPGQAPPPLPAPMLFSRPIDREARIASFIQHFQALAGKAVRVPDASAAGRWLAEFMAGRKGVASNAPYLVECGIERIPEIERGIQDSDALRLACSTAQVGITSVTYALAETGTMVLQASREEPRLISLLPPVHVAIFPVARLLVGLDELFTLHPRPVEETSSLVFITGPSRTADIEQILVRGVHGPGEILAVLVES